MDGTFGIVGIMEDETASGRSLMNIRNRSGPYMYIVIGCWFYIIRPSVQTLFFALSPYFSLCLCHFELSLYCKASNNKIKKNNNIEL